MDKSEILSRLRQEDPPELNAVLGFDACIDNIIRVVKGKDEGGKTIYFDDSRGFGDFLISHQGISCGVELETRVSKIGGNMVIMANALGNLGVKSQCIGTFGLPEILPVFRSMSVNCSLSTIGETITASAMEFNDSKKIMFDPGPYNYLGWDDVKNHLGLGRIRELFSGKQLISLVNWSEIARSSELWEGIINEVLPFVTGTEHKTFVFIDFSDCSRKQPGELRNALRLVRDFNKFLPVTVSLNQNEASVMLGILGLDEALPDHDLLEALLKAMGVTELVLHRTRDAVAYSFEGFAGRQTFYCAEPRILTGGGDNFNAGYCFARFLELPLPECLLVANAVSGYYVKNGKSPSRPELAGFLENNFR